MGIMAGQRREAWIDPARWWQRIGYEPYAQQLAAHASNARFKVVVAGKRTGKSYWGSREAEPLILTPETVTWIVGVQYDRAEKEFSYIWDDLFRKAKLEALESHYNVRGGHMYIRTAWNSVIQVKSAKDERALESEACDQIIVAEPAQHKESTIELLMERLMEKRGTLILPGTPSTDGHWLKRYYDRGQDPGEPDWYSIRFSGEEVPYPGRDECLRLKPYLSELRYRRDILAEFVATARIVYPTFEQSTHVDAEAAGYRRNLITYTVHDFGYTDPTVCLLCQEDPSMERLFVVDEYYKTRRTNEQNAKAVAAWLAAKGYPEPQKLDGCYPDPSAPGAIAELKKLGFRPVTRGVVSRQEEETPIKRGVEIVRRFLGTRSDGRPGLIVHPRCKHTIDEAGTYHNKKGTDEPADEDNHCWDPIRYGLMNRHGGRRGPSIRQVGGGGDDEDED